MYRSGYEDGGKTFILNNEYLCDRIIDSALSLIQTKKPHFTFQSTCFDYTLLQYNPFETIHVHHNGQFHFVTSCSISGKVKLFDSLNLQPSEELIKQINTLYAPDPTVKNYREAPKTVAYMPLLLQQNLLLVMIPATSSLTNPRCVNTYSNASNQGQLPDFPRLDFCIHNQLIMKLILSCLQLQGG